MTTLTCPHCGKKFSSTHDAGMFTCPWCGGAVKMTIHGKVSKGE